MSVPSRSLDEINARAMKLLADEFGSADATRFLHQFTSVRGNYTLDRDELFGQQSLSDIIAKIKSKKAGPKPA